MIIQTSPQVFDHSDIPPNIAILVDESALANTITTSVALANLWGF